MGSSTGYAFEAALPERVMSRADAWSDRDRRGVTLCPSTTQNAKTPAGDGSLRRLLRFDSGDYLRRPSSAINSR